MSLNWTVNAGEGRVYRVWCYDSTKPIEFIQAPSSFAARKAYSELYKVAAFNCMSRWEQAT